MNHVASLPLLEEFDYLTCSKQRCLLNYACLVNHLYHRKGFTLFILPKRFIQKTLHVVHFAILNDVQYFQEHFSHINFRGKPTQGKILVTCMQSAMAHSGSTTLTMIISHMVQKHYLAITKTMEICKESLISHFSHQHLGCFRNGVE